MIDKYILQNNKWAKSQTDINPNFFQKISQKQSPSIFWVGCCDSRVIPTEILNLSLGDVFIQTNIANQMNLDDDNAVSSLEYAINILKVKYVNICGHTHCGGIQAALSDEEDLPPAIKRWLDPIKKLKKTLPIDDTTDPHPLMVELNIKHQVKMIEKSSTLQALWEKGLGPSLHGWVFELEKGRVRELCMSAPPSKSLKASLFLS